MTRTTLTIIVEHYEPSEFSEAIMTVVNHVNEGFISGSYEGSNDLTVDFKTEVTEA